jgi:hypothetical protein
MLVTLGVLGIWRAVGFSFGNRYALFAAFFAQFVLAEVIAFGIFSLLGPLTELPAVRPLANGDRPATVALSLAALTTWLPSPMMASARQTKDFGTLWSPGDVLGRPSAHASYYAQFSELEPHLSPDDVVMMPISRTVFDLAAITGVAVVRSPNAHGVPDRHARTRDVKAFFDPTTSPELRRDIVRKYGVSKVIATRQEFSILADLSQVFGEPVHRSENYAVYRVGT